MWLRLAAIRLIAVTKNVEVLTLLNTRAQVVAGHIEDFEMAEIDPPLQIHEVKLTYGPFRTLVSFSQVEVTREDAKRAPSTQQAILEILKEWSPHAILLASALWAVNGYLDQKSGELRQDKARLETHKMEIEKAVEAREFEIRKPFLEDQKRIFNETAKVVGDLVFIDTTSEKWKEAVERFWPYRWIITEMYGNADTRRALRDVQAAIIGVREGQKLLNEELVRETNADRRAALEKDFDQSVRHNLRWKVECVGHALRATLGKNWNEPVEAQPVGCFAPYTPGSRYHFPVPEIQSKVPG